MLTNMGPDASWHKYITPQGIAKDYGPNDKAPCRLNRTPAVRVARIIFLWLAPTVEKESAPFTESSVNFRAFASSPSIRCEIPAETGENPTEFLSKNAHFVHRLFQASHYCARIYKLAHPPRGG